jgi:hypothetical protein
LIDYGKVAETSTRNHFYEQALRPAVYVREYIQRIFNLSGYTYECDFFDTAFFKRLIVPNNDDRLKIQVTNLLDLGSNYSTTFNASPYTLLWTSGSFRDFNSIGSGQYQYVGISALTNINFNFGFDMRFSLGPGTYSFELWKNGAFFQTLDSFNTSGFPTGPGFNFRYLKNISTTASIAVNDIFKVNILYTPAGGGTFSVGLDVYINTWTIDAPVKVLSPAVINDTIQMRYAVPQNIKITDFFTSILKMFNLYVVEDKNISKKLIITPYIDFYLNESLDWSDKLDRSQEIRLKPMGELNARVFNFKYKNDDAYWNKTYKEKYNEGYMDYSYDSEYEYAKDKDDLEVIFASTVNYAPNNQPKIIPALYKEGNFADESITSSNIRILQTKMLTVSNWDIKNTGGGNYHVNITQFPYSGMWEHPTVPDNGTYFESLGWASPKEIYYTITGTTVNYGLFNSFWSQYFAEITNPNSTILTAQFHLTSMDIRTLDFAKNILIDGTMWRINKVEGYDPLSEKPTKVELLKVIDTIY